MKLIILICILISIKAASFEIHIPSEVHVQSKPKYTLYDIAILKQGSTNDFERLKSMSLSDLSKRSVLVSAKEMGDTLKLVLPEAIMFKEHNVFQKSEAERKIMNHLVSDCNVCIFEVNLTQVPLVSNTELNFRASDFNFKTASFLIKVTSATSVSHGIIAGNWRAFKKVPVINKWLAQNQKIQRDDLSQDIRDVTYIYDKLFSEEDLIGATLARSAGAKTVITRDMVSKETIVKKGDQIRILIKNGPIEVETNGISESSGAKGDLVKVRVSNKIINGTVESENKVVSE